MNIPDLFILFYDRQILLTSDHDFFVALKGLPQPFEGVRKVLPWLETAPGIYTGEALLSPEDWKELTQLSGGISMDFREAYGGMTPHQRSRASRTFQLNRWNLNHQFCGKCGQQNKRVEGVFNLRCEDCGLDHFPKICPAVICLIHKGDQILLARNLKTPQGFYSHVAGFVEVGESLEQTVAREIAEEVGLKVTDIRYIESQSWPFPDNLMLGFTAAWLEGEPKPDGVEIGDAQWFSFDTLPKLPRKGSISRSMIECFYNKEIP